MTVQSWGHGQTHLPKAHAFTHLLIHELTCLRGWKSKVKLDLLSATYVHYTMNRDVFYFRKEFV